MKHITAAFLALALLFSGCAGNTENRGQLTGTNIDGLSVYGELGEIHMPDGTVRAMPKSSEIRTVLSMQYWDTILFVNGSIAPVNSLRSIENGEVYVAVDVLTDMLGMEPTEPLTCVQLDGLKGDYFPLREAADAYPFTYLSYDPTAAGKYMLMDTPHVMLWHYPDGAAAKTAEEATDHLESLLITAYENVYGTFTPYDDAPPSLNQETEFLRWQIPRLSVESENDRFYIIPCVWDFYVDKYTDDVFTHYHGTDETFTKFDPMDENALRFPG